MLEQRNFYNGAPERGWVHVRLPNAEGTARDVELLADTGSPCAVIVGTQDMDSMVLISGQTLQTNFGELLAGWLRVVIPEIAFDQLVLGYTSDAVVAAARTSSPDFSGMIGLPLLRMMHFGGDADSFWIQPAASTL